MAPPTPISLTESFGNRIVHEGAERGNVQYRQWANLCRYPLVRKESISGSLSDLHSRRTYWNVLIVDPDLHTNMSCRPSALAAMG